MNTTNGESLWTGANRKRILEHRWVWMMVLLPVLLFTAIVHAQICVPPSRGVPPSYEPPHWWNNTPSQPIYYQKLTDPRWEGAAAVSKTDGTQETNTFLALQDGTYVYLSWRYSGMPLGSVGQNVLYVGYERASDSKPVIVKAELTTMSGIEAGDVGFVDRNAFELDQLSGTLGDDISDPSWVAETVRVWINNPTANSYAVQMRIPISDLKLGAGTFKLWFEMLAGSPEIPITRFVWPRSGADIGEQPTPPFEKTFPLPMVWETFKLSTGPSDPSCPAQGVSLDQNKIATKNPSPNEILYKKSPNPKPENILFARPTNNSSVNIPAGKLKATFRIANWGSQPNFADWEVGVPIDVLWAKVPCVGADINGAVGTVGDIANGVTAPEASEIRCSWTLTDAEITPFEDGTRNSHSCILVEMLDTMIPGLVYRNRSMWNNFEVRQASKIAEQARISIKGLAPISPSGRDVYVYVETRNMPDRIKEDDRKAIYVHTEVPGASELGRAIAEGKVSSVGLSRMIAAGQVSDSTLNAVLPTYIIRVYHDTGKSLTIGGVRRPVLNPQGSFGYRVTHAGDLLGWKHELKFESGYTIDELAPCFYRIRQVPNNGEVAVTTKIEALEPGLYRKCFDWLQIR